MGLHFAFAGFRVALLHADYANLDSLTVYLHWGFEIPTWDFEHSGHVIGVLEKYWVDYHVFLVACVGCRGRALVHLHCL